MGLCILAAILRLWNRAMLAHLIEFATNHYVLSGCFVFLLVLLIVTELRKGGKSLSSRELTALVNSEQGVVLDVRNHKDFSSGHIVDALNIPFDKLAERMVELEKHKAKTMLKWACEVEQVHADLYKQALASLETGKDLDTLDVYICPLCGHVLKNTWQITAFPSLPLRCGAHILFPCTRGCAPKAPRCQRAPGGAQPMCWLPAWGNPRKWLPPPRLLWGRNPHTTLFFPIITPIRQRMRGT